MCSDACAIHAKFASVRMRIYGMLGNFVAEGKPEVQTTMDRMSDPQWDDLSSFLSQRSVVSVKTDPVTANDL